MDQVRVVTDRIMINFQTRLSGHTSLAQKEDTMSRRKGSSHERRNTLSLLFFYCSPPCSQSEMADYQAPSRIA
jgi:hypothetical protein